MEVLFFLAIYVIILTLPFLIVALMIEDIVELTIKLWSKITAKRSD